MKRSYCPPNDFEITEKHLAWAIKTFNITEKEVERQTELWHEWEYKRAYFDWNRAWKRWFRQADKYGLLHRDVKPRVVEVVTDEQRQADILAFESDPLIRKARAK